MPDKNIIVSIREVEPGLVSAIKKLSQKLGYELQGIVLIDKGFVDNPHRVKDMSGFFEEIVCDFDDAHELQRVTKAFSDKVLAVTCRFETAIQDFRKAIPFFPYCNTPTESSLLWSTEKRLMRDRLHGYDESLTPKYVQITEQDIENVPQMVSEYQFPVIVKPNGLYASLLVSRCNNRDELDAALWQTFQVIDEVYARENGTGKPSVLIEEMMQGDMYSIDAYVDEVGKVYCLPLVQVITAHMLGLPGFYSYRHIIPTPLSDEDFDAAKKVSEAAVHALGLRSTTTHIELFLTDHGWKVIELGPRIGGYREGLYYEAYEVDHYYNDIAIRIGLEPIIPTVAVKHAAGVNIYADEEGVINSISNVEEAKKLGSVVFVDVHAKAGDIALFAGNGGELIVDAILSNEDAEKLERDVARLRELIQIKISPQRTP